MRSRTIYSMGKPIAVYENGDLVWSAKEFVEKADKSAYIMPDIEPYKSMVDGSEITSRSKHREHLKANGLIEVGNEMKHLKPKTPAAPPGLKETLARVAYEKLRYGRK